MQSDPVMGTPNDPRTLHNYAYAFNNPVNLVDPSGLMPFTLQRQQRQNQNLAVLGRQNSYAVQPDTQVGYVGAAVGQGGFNTSYLGQAAQPDGMAAPRAAMGQAEQNWQPFSDPEPRQQSQGFRPKACGFTDVLFGFGSSALSGHLLYDAFDFAIHIPTLVRPYWPLLRAIGQFMSSLQLGHGGLITDPSQFRLDPISRSLGQWLNGQIEQTIAMGKQMVQAFQNGDYRMAASIGFHMAMWGAVAALGASGVGAPVAILAAGGLSPPEPCLMPCCTAGVGMNF